MTPCTTCTERYAFNMPKSEYFKGKGDKVYASMKKGKSKKEADREFYATANKRHMNPTSKKK